MKSAKQVLLTGSIALRIGCSIVGFSLSQDILLASGRIPQGSSAGTDENQKGKELVKTGEQGNGGTTRLPGNSVEPQRVAPVEPKITTLGRPDDRTSYNASPEWGSAWCNLGSPSNFSPGDHLRLTVGGRAKRVIVRLLPVGMPMDTPAEIVDKGGFDVPANRVIDVPIRSEYRNISQISVHGGLNPWGLYPLGNDNGPATLVLVQLVRYP